MTVDSGAAALTPPARSATCRSTPADPPAVARADAARFIFHGFCGIARHNLTPDEIDYLVRASLDLRGVRPSPDEIAQVEANPNTVDDLVDGFFHDDLITGGAFVGITRLRTQQPGCRRFKSAH